MDLKNPLLLLCIGLLIGIVLTETVYYFYSPLVLPEGAIEIISDRDYFPRVNDLLSNAENEIHIVMFSANYQTGSQYEFSSTNRLLQNLVAARNRGVNVTIVLDDWPKGNEKTLNYLRNNNVAVRLKSMDGSTHAKLIVIDNKIVVVGSTNWSYHSLDKNHEANVVINNRRLAQEFNDYATFLFSSSQIP